MIVICHVNVIMVLLMVLGSVMYLSAPITNYKKLFKIRAYVYTLAVGIPIPIFKVIIENAQK